MFNMDMVFIRVSKGLKVKNFNSYKKYSGESMFSKYFLSQISTRKSCKGDVFRS